METLKLSIPLDLSFSKSLPAMACKTWCVYVIILEKAEHSPKLAPGLGSERSSTAQKPSVLYERSHSPH